MRYLHVVFDIDGTLIDSEKAVLKSLQKTLLEVKGVNVNLSDLKFALGIPGRDALLKLNIGNLEQVENMWNEYYNDYLDDIKLFNGIREVIEELKSKSIKLGIITSKTRKEYETDFMRFELDDYFDVVICADDTLKHKPDGEPMEKYLKIANAKKEETIYIGDSIYDMQCAKNAEVDSILALWGREDLDTLKATYKLNSPKDILEIII
ncbi:HAD family hydrolase [Clostridium septicum]|uniref:HAD family hydrolase n=1 Tax=Clostridium septicum TaxID=1504 RepID=A0A9N7PKP0_CLOSE|nr:HAD family hydrolase [Clostridium septicum]AYE34257.1 phosphatase [Clostridium septicum]MDU1313289.1 HAD family hydrolase [Clostridium septicum]QAS59664.1 HAD family hydrolase [Clostridium septicum]UEC21105.1 HAD family hydrolase [Clostridium septicum]USS00846.1 HAD family hydrolase [Clostridium septicum]